MHDYFPVFGTTTRAAFGFEQLAQDLQISLGARKARHERHLLAAALLFIELHPQLLLLRWQGGGHGILIGLVGEIRIGGIDDALALIFISFHTSNSLV